MRPRSLTAPHGSAMIALLCLHSLRIYELRSIHSLVYHHAKFADLCDPPCGWQFCHICPHQYNPQHSQERVLVGCIHWGTRTSHWLLWQKLRGYKSGWILWLASCRRLVRLLLDISKSYKSVNFLQKTRDMHPITRPLGRVMGPDLCSTLIDALWYSISYDIRSRYIDARLYLYSLTWESAELIASQPSIRPATIVPKLWSFGHLGYRFLWFILHFWKLINCLLSLFLHCYKKVSLSYGPIWHNATCDMAVTLVKFSCVCSYIWSYTCNLSSHWPRALPKHW